MSMNQIQFQKGLSLKEFISKFGTKVKCEEWLENLRWPNGFQCPKCGSYQYCIVWHGSAKTFQCDHCRSQTTLTSGTVFHKSKIALTTWFQAMFLMTQSKNSIAALELMRVLGICYRSAWRLKHKLIQAMTEREERRLLSGRIEVDDSYFGGERTGGKVGRGSENKIPFIAAVQTDGDGHPMSADFKRVKTFSTKEVSQWAEKAIGKGSLVVSDGLACFRGVEREGVVHSPRVAGSGKKGAGMECFKWVNTILGNLKNSIKGTYHSVKFGKYADRYLGEFQYRFNRRQNLGTIMIRLAVACIQSSFRSEKWLRLAEA